MEFNEYFQHEKNKIKLKVGGGNGKVLGFSIFIYINNLIFIIMYNLD
jgi:hypothetical protein